MAKKVVDEEALADINDAFPSVNDNSNRLSLPRFGMLSKDITKETGSGRNKKIEVVEASGTFFTESGSGKDVERTYIDGEEQEVIIVFHRKQVKHFDKGLNKFISSPIFDTDDQIIPLYLDKRVVARGTKAELQAKYPEMSQAGKKSTSLKENKILYVIYKGEFYSSNLSLSSGWAFSDYAKEFRDGDSPATVVTTIGSVEETNGSNTYRKMTFTDTRPITADELELVKEKQALIRDSAKQSQEFYLGQANLKIEAPENVPKDKDGKPF